jgi:hypothetical protein
MIGAKLSSEDSIDSQSSLVMYFSNNYRTSDLEAITVLRDWNRARS